MIDDRLIGKKNDEGEEKVVFNFVKENNKKLENEMKSGNDTNFLPIEKFKDEFDDDAPPVILPYETIDVKYKKFINIRLYLTEIMFLQIINILIQYILCMTFMMIVYGDL